jgi:hypothetical protein
MQAGLALLLQSREMCLALGSDAWEFAVEIDQLRAAGLTNPALRWLITQGHVEHRLEVTGRRALHRRFRSAANLALGSTSCFVLTEQGSRLANACTAAPEVGEVVPNGGVKNPAAPHWDAERRQLRYGGIVVKEFRGRPGTQELILAVFEEEEWSPRIDDPLPPADDIDPPTRLRETIRRLNGGQLSPLMRFQADGRGGILWLARKKR